jgi:hypothetical protein
MLGALRQTREPNPEEPCVAVLAAKRIDGDEAQETLDGSPM